MTAGSFSKSLLRQRTILATLYFLLKVGNPELRCIMLKKFLIENFEWIKMMGGKIRASNLFSYPKNYSSLSKILQL